MPAAQFILDDQPDAAIARITLNRTDKHNSQDTRLLYELNAAFDRAAQDPEVKVIVLAANGKNFSAGHDLSGMGDRDAVHAEYPQVTTTSRPIAVFTILRFTTNLAIWLSLKMCASRNSATISRAAQTS